MRRQHSGLLIHVSSGAGRVVVPGAAAYSASKFALEALADAYRFELSASSPGLWIGLVLAGVFLTAAVRLRRYQGPI